MKSMSLSILSFILIFLVYDKNGVREGQSRRLPPHRHSRQQVVVPGQLGTDVEVIEHKYNSTNIIYDGCISFKSCFAPVDRLKINSEYQTDCILSLDCDMVWAIGKMPYNEPNLPHPEEDEIVLEMYAGTTVWVAVGISDDREMGKDYVLECVKDETGTVRLYNSWNLVRTVYQQRLHDNTRLAGPDKSIAKLVQTRASENSLYCRIHLKRTFTITNPATLNIFIYELGSKSYCVLAAYGDKGRYRGDEMIGIDGHEGGLRNGKAACQEFTHLTYQRSPSIKQVEHLHSHGAGMAIGYLGLLSISIFVARYYQTCFTNVPQFKNVELWVWIHAVFGVAGALLIATNLVYVTIVSRNWKGTMSFPFHRFGGYISVLSIVPNVFIGFYIRKTDHASERKSIFYVVHAISGHVGLVLGLFVVMLSDHMEYAFIPCSTGDWGLAYVLLYFLFHCLMSTSRYWLKKFMNQGKVRATMLTPAVLLTQKHVDAEWVAEYPETIKARYYFLATYIIFVVTFTIVVAYLIITSTGSCSLEKTWKVHKDHFN